MKRWMLLLMAALLCVSLFGCAEEPQAPQGETVEYKGKTYCAMVLPEDIFFYQSAAPMDEVGEVLPFPHEKWELVSFMDELYVEESQAEEAAAYYADRDHYEWTVLIDDVFGDQEKRFAVTVSEDTEEAINQLPDLKQEKTMLFEEMEVSASLIKTDQAKLYSGSISLAKVEGAWYWRSEVIDAEAEGSPEYIQPLPQELAAQIETALAK
ncbi:MAG: hypothetical protein IJN82_06305 [Clostridia bacterium]|nr:hypothetical protein [Clostridia bacterium]